MKSAQPRTHILVVAEMSTIYFFWAHGFYINKNIIALLYTRLHKTPHIENMKEAILRADALVARTADRQHTDSTFPALLIKWCER